MLVIHLRMPMAVLILSFAATSGSTILPLTQYTTGFTLRVTKSTQIPMAL